jgi:hypothetical protein
MNEAGYDTREEAIAAGNLQIEELGSIEFQGDDDCAITCDGWSGDSRCDCGNRRVAWSTDQDEHGKWHSQAVAH